MTPWFRNRRHRLPLIAIVVFSVSLLVGFGRLLDESRQNQTNLKELLYWSASQTVVEYWRFMDALGSYATGLADTGHDEVLLRLDILWSRINIYGEGDVGQHLKAVAGAEQTIAGLSRTLRRIEPDLLALTADDKEGLRSIRERLTPHATRLQLMAQQTNLREQASAIDFRATTARTYWFLLAFLFGILLSGILLIALLFREIRGTNQLLQAANAAETMAQGNAERLGAVLNSSVVSIVTIDAEGIIQSFNPAAERLFGYKAEDVVSRNVSILMAESLHAAHDGHLARYQETGEVKIIGRTREISARRADGSTLPVEISVGEMRFGAATGFVGFIVDITERKQAEDALKASEQRFRDVADVAGDWVWETDREHRYTYFSDQMAKVTGLTAKDLLGKTRRELSWSDGSDPRWEKLYEEIEAHRLFRDFSFEIHGPSIETRHVRISGKPIFDADGKFDGYRGTGTDVTAQVEAEAEVARKTALLHATFDNMIEGINVVDGSGKIAAANSRFRQLFDMPATATVVGLPFEQIVRSNAESGEYGPGDVEELTRRQIDLTRLGPRVDEHTRPNGMTLERRANPLPDGGFVATYVDITERKRAENALRDAHDTLEQRVLERTADLEKENLERKRIEAKLRKARDEMEDQVADRTTELGAVLESAVVGIVTIDARGIINSFNRSAEKLFGYAAKEVIGRNVSMLMPEPLSGAHDGYLARYLTGAEPRIVGRVRQIIGRRSDGSTVPMELSVGKMLIHGEVRFVGNISDISERLNQEERLRQALKMESLGQLTGGVAHEFNNLLTAISGFAQMARRKVEDAERVRDCLEQIVTASDQAAGLTRQMLAFARKQELEPRVVSTNQILDDLRTMVRPVIGDAIPLRMSLVDEETYALIDPAQLSQAILNLAINGCYAMPDGGELLIGNRITELDETLAARFPHAAAGRYVAVFVSDTGTGIDKKTLDRIFEPFFTTKAPGEGTGLGLAMVYGMVEQSGGLIDVESEVGTGTTFTIYLPLVEDVERASGAGTGPAREETKSATIFIAVDREPVRDLARVTLESLGYAVLTAEGGVSVVEVYREHAEDVDLLLTDMAVSGKNDLMRVHELVAENTKLKVVFLSRHIETGDPNAETLGRERVVLRVPFDPDELGRVVGQVIAA